MKRRRRSELAGLPGRTRRLLRARAGPARAVPGVHDGGYRHAGRGVAVRPALLRLRCAGDPATASGSGRSAGERRRRRTGSGVADRVRRGGLALVMVGALSVSVRGQVQAVEPLLGGMSVVLALTNDLAALLGAERADEPPAARRYGAGRGRCCVLAGGTAAGLNTWHALRPATLPPVWAVVVGIGPVLLAVVLSHLVALVLDRPHRSSRRPGSHQRRSVAATGRAAANPPVPGAGDRSAPAPVRARENESSRAAQVPTAALSGPGVHLGLAVVPARREHRSPHRPAAGRRVPATGRSGTDPRVERLAAQLRAGAELTGVRWPSSWAARRGPGGGCCARPRTTPVLDEDPGREPAEEPRTG